MSMISTKFGDYVKRHAVI